MSQKSKLKNKLIAFSLSATVVATGFAPSVVGAAEKPVVAENEYYTDAVNYLVNNEILIGDENGELNVNNSLTKAEAAKIIVLANNIDVKNYEVKDPGFDDVQKDDWYYDYVAVAKEKGYVQGNEKGDFEPNKVINRAEMASMLVKAFDLQAGENTEVSFTDVKKENWFYDEVQALVSTEVTTGTSATTYSPNDQVLRAQGATFVYRAMNVDQEAPVVGDINVQFSDESLNQTVAVNGKTEETVNVQVNSTLSGLTVSVQDENIVKEDVTVKLTAVPEGYPEDAPAVPNTWGTLVYNEETKLFELAVPEQTNPYTFILPGDYTLETTFKDTKGNETDLTFVVTVGDFIAPVAGELNLTFADETTKKVDFAGQEQTELTIAAGSTLKGLSLAVTDDSLAKEDINVLLTGVPEDYPEDAPAIPNIWGTLVYNEETSLFELIVPAEESPYTFNLTGDHELTATLVDQANNEREIKILVTVE